jgi:FtsZ-binding cell division protein ZapB
MTAIEEITDLKMRIETITEEKAALEARIAGYERATDADLSNAKALTSDNAALKAELAAVIETHGKATAEAAAKVTALESDLAKAKGLLRDPALAVVQAAVPSTTVPAGAEGGASIKTREQWNAEYDALPSKTRADAQARAEFRQAHAKELGL